MVNGAAFGCDELNAEDEDASAELMVRLGLALIVGESVVVMMMHPSSASESGSIDSRIDRDIVVMCMYIGDSLLIYSVVG